MNITDIVNVSVNNTTVTPQQADFGTLMIFSVNAAWVELSRTYSSQAGVLLDWAADSPEAIFAGKAFGQKVAPKTIKIGRGTHKPTQQYTVGQSALRNSDSTSYQINVVGQGVTASTPAYTSDSTATAQEIHNGLVTALNAVTGKNYTATFAPLPTFTTHTFTAAANVVTDNAHGFNTGDGPFELTTTVTLPTGLSLATDYFVVKIDANTYNLATSLANALAGTIVTISSSGTGTHSINADTTLSPILPFLVTGNAAGNWFSLEVLDRTALSVTQTHADPGIATDLAALRLVDTGWYTFVTFYNSKALVLAAAAWAESQGDVAYFPQVVDTTSVQTAVQSPLDGNHDTLQALAALTYNRTVGSWHHSPASGFSAAWNGRTLPIPAGSESWDAKDIQGVTASNLTETEFTNLKARKATCLASVAGLTITVGGTTAGGQAFGVVRGLAWWKDDLQTSLLATKVAADKLEFEDSGIARLEATSRSSTKRAIDRKILAKNPTPTFAFPLVANVSPTDKANRVLNATNAINATLSGEIDTITIGVNVSF